MSFLYPLFLLASLAVAIPIFLHLFNLRRYKTVYFPHTRFLKNIQLRSQKQSELKYKWLLALRILFLLSLVLAFAQPFLQNTSKQVAGDTLQVIYLDNSASMSLKNGARSLLDIAKEKLRKQLQQAPAGSKFLLLTNDKPLSYQPLEAAKLINQLNTIDISPATKSFTDIFDRLIAFKETESADKATLYYYSDFQENDFPAMPPADIEKQDIDFYGIPIRSETVSNIFIDTAILTTPLLQAGKPNELVVTTKYVGKPPKEETILQLYVNGQVKSATGIDFSAKKQSIDTLHFQVSEAGWQELSIVINDAVQYDDSFRIAARSHRNLSVLVVNETQSNPFLQAVFASYDGFTVDTRSIGEPVDWEAYNLILLNGITSMSENMASQIKKALQRGQTVTVFPGATKNIAGLNAGLSSVSTIRLEGIDTVAQNATSLQQGSELVRNIFERIPDNVQLPKANWHYKIKSGLTANQQSVISFRNGDPLLAKFSPYQGRLYLLATVADMTGGDFQQSYFFAPFLYEMASQSQTGNVLVTTAGNSTPVFIAMRQTNERDMLHLQKEGVDIIPSQRPAGAGMNVFAGAAAQQAGFYRLTASAQDSIKIAINEDRQESYLQHRDMKNLQSAWGGENIRWMEVNTNDIPGDAKRKTSFPLWKVCIILALIMLAAETYLLAANRYKKSIATT